MILPADHNKLNVIVKGNKHGRIFVSIYVVITSILNIYFLYIIKPNVANDLWWRDFTTSGPQTFLADLYHRCLQFNQSHTVDLFAPEVLLEKEYPHNAPTFIDMSLSLSRQILLANISFHNAIQAMRQSTFEWNVRMFTQYCWVDWNQTYELSVTAKRQHRCLINDADNAAVYWESLFRNSHYDGVFNGSYATSLQVSLFDTITSTPRGQLWLSSIWAHPWLAVHDEANVWLSRGLRRWQTELTNYYEQGLLQTIAVQNAFGSTQHITVHLKAQAYRGLSVWTLSNCYEGVWNDLWEGLALNCSLIRGANNYSDQIKLDWESLVYAIPTGNTLADLVDASIGVLGSIDVKYHPKPSQLEEYYLTYHKHIVPTIWANKTLSNAYTMIPPLIVSVSPQKWRGANMMYYGGNPMCLSNRPMPFVQDQFGFYASCASQTETTMTLSRHSMLFALWTAQHSLHPLAITKICDQTTSNQGFQRCHETLANLTVISNALEQVSHSDIDTANLENVMNTLNLTMIQFALNASIPTFLTQSVVGSGDSWSFFGWAMVYDWLHGDREVFRFESDQGSFVLITQYTEPTPFPANPLELPQQACAYIWVILVYSTVVLSLVAFVVFLTTLLSRDYVCSHDVFHFHRVASMVWVGRPFLTLRGFAALILLSTSPLTFVSTNGMSKFVFEPRNVMDIMVIASEATWITYVVVDLLLPVTKNTAATYAPVSAVMAWLITFFTEFINPFEATASIDQSCYVTQLGLSATCTGGTVQIGSPQRLMLLCVVQLGSVLVSLLVVCIWKTATPSTENGRDVYLPAAARYFFSATSIAQWSTNATIAIMSGILPMRSSYFHVNLWQLVHLDEPSHKQLAWSVPHIPQQRVKSMTLAFLGILYVLFSVGGSITFIFVSETAMANDFWWASFNSSGHQTFLATLFTTQLQVSGVVNDLDLTSLQYADNTNLYNTTDTTFRVPLLYATMIQDEVNTLANVVQSLRQMDGCPVPWIASHFCYVDFDRAWEMGISAHRQQQCASHDSNNGAVYLESYLRNVNWDEYDDCWHTSLEIAVLSFLRTSITGQQWIQSTTTTNTITVTEEVNYWTQKGITEFTTQWQNYKALGVLESFAIQNAFGMSYPITLKYSNGSMHTNMQTSFKMQWPLASQFWAIASNSSILSGTSLVRQSPRFAFANMTMFSALVNNQTVVTPLNIGFVIIQNTIGPFGEVTMRRIAIPSILVEWNKMIQLHVKLRMPTLRDDSVAKFRSISGILSMVGAPKTWGTSDFVGGDITCPTQVISPFVCIYYSMQGACVVNMEDSLDIDNLEATQTLLALGPEYNIYTACNDSTMQYTAQCISFLIGTRDFITTAFNNAEWLTIAELSMPTTNYFRTTLPLLVAQYTANTTGIYLIQSNIFDPEDVGYHIFGWVYLLEWIKGVREVVQFEGQHGISTIFSARNAIRTAPVNALEIPLNVAYYARCILLYVTSVLFLVACIACYYIARSQAAIEGINMFCINRVTGLVWIGRPLLFLRGITAICLLSTAKLDLHQNNGFFYMVSVPQSWFTTIMASGEVTWLVFIINDSFSVLSKQYTPIYATQSSIVVWIAAAIWCLTLPVNHRASSIRSCTVVEVDYQVVCESGVVVIGDKTRFIGLIALAMGLVLLCYLIQRCRYPRVIEYRIASHLLYATAFHHFRQDRWIYNNVYYMDRASAAINGLITYRLKNRQVIVLDIKTWRVFVIPLLPMSSDIDIFLIHALPLS